MVLTLEYHNSVNMRARKTHDTLKDAQRSKDYVYEVFKQKYGICTQQAHFEKKFWSKKCSFFSFFFENHFFLFFVTFCKKEIKS